MDVMIIASKGCTHSKNLVKELEEIGVKHRLVYAEDEPQLVQKYQIRHSPNLVVNDEVKFRRQPTEHELRECFNLK